MNGRKFENLNDYFVHAITEQDNTYFTDFLFVYEHALNEMISKFIERYGLQDNDHDDLYQIFVLTLWELLRTYDPADPIPLLQYAKHTHMNRWYEYVRTVKTACSVSSHNGYAVLRKVLRIYNTNSSLSCNDRIQLIMKETGLNKDNVVSLINAGYATGHVVPIVFSDDDYEAFDTVDESTIEDCSVSVENEVLYAIRREQYIEAANLLTPKEKQIIELSCGVCLDCIGTFPPKSYAQISLMQGASGEKSIEKKRKTATERFIRNLCELGFCEAVELNLVSKKSSDRKTVSVHYRYKPYFGGESGEVFIDFGENIDCNILMLAEYDCTGVYAEQAIDQIIKMGEKYIKHRLCALPLSAIPNVNPKNCTP